MPINSNFRMTSMGSHMGMSMMSGGFRGPGASMMAGMGSASAALDQMLLETVTFLTNAGPRATRLGNAAAAIPAAFNPRTVVSADPSVVQIASFNGENLSDLNIRVHQLATTQRNSGTALNRTEKIDAEGLFKFEIEVDGKAHEISFTVEPSEDGITNQQFQQKMATAINEANLGITATVNVSGANATLSIETGTTGPGMEGGPRFTIRDIEGDAVAKTNVGEITQEAGNAIFSVNGGAKQNNATNRIDLGNGLVVNLIAPSDEPVGIHMGQDRFSMQGAVVQLVREFNSMLETAHLNNGDRNTRMLIRNLQDAARFSRRDLERIGITADRLGFLSIDEAAMNEAINNGSLDRFFRGTDTRSPNAFVARLDRIAANVSRDPMRHVSPHASRMPGFNTAMNAVREHQNQQNNNSNNTPNAAQQASPFDAYWPDDIIGQLINALS